MRENVSKLSRLLNEAYILCETEFDVTNPLDKSKWREIIVASILSHKLFIKASGGQNSLTYGADAHIDGTNAKAEYKTATITKKHYDEFMKKNLTKQYGMIYNGAYSTENIQKYKGTKQYLALFYRAICVVIVEVPERHVLSTLHENLAARLGKKGKTTNCNSVLIKFMKNEPSIGRIVYEA